MNNVDITPFERVKDLAKKKNITLSQLALNSGLGENSLYRWKQRNPSSKNLKAVADELNVSVDYLLGNTDEMHPSNATKKDNVIDLDQALSEHGTAMFQGHELSDDYKQAVLAVLNTLHQDKE